MFSIFSGVCLYLNNGGAKIAPTALPGAMSMGDCIIPTAPELMSPQVANAGVTAPQFRGPMDEAGL